MNQKEFEKLFSDFDPEATDRDIRKFLRDNFETRLGKRGFVLGLSGGIDSALVATLITRAEIPLTVVRLPDTYRPESQSIRLADKMIEFLGIPESRVKTIELKEMLDARCRVCGNQYPSCGNMICRGNRAARQRMIELYALAHSLGGVVCGTENLTEYYLGYFTLHGDAASDIEPIHGLLKTEVRMLAKFHGIPKEVIGQEPSAELWDGQTDEGELGFSYGVADSVLKTGFNPRYLKQLEITEEETEKVIRRIRITDFKRQEKPVWAKKIPILDWD